MKKQIHIPLPARSAWLIAALGALSLLAGIGLGAAPVQKKTFVYVHDRSLSNTQVYGFLLGADGSLSPLANSPFAGGGPNSSVCGGNCETLAYSPRKQALIGSSTAGLFVWQVAGDGDLTLVPGSPFGSGNCVGVGVVEKRASTFVYTATPDTGDVHSFRLNSDRTLTPLNSFESNNGPLGVSVHGPLLFVANEGGGGGESFLTSFRAKNNGDLKRAPTQSVAVGPGLVGETYNVFVSPNGKTLYAADTSASQIFGYRVNQSNAALTPLSGSPFPTAAVVNPTGLALAKSLVVLLGSNTSGLDDLQVFRRLGNGDLQALSGLQNSGIKSQKAAALSPDGKILVSASEANDQVRSFLVDGATGALTPVETETAETGKVNGVVIITR